MASSEFPQSGQRQSPSNPYTREAWTPTFDGPPTHTENTNNNHGEVYRPTGRSPSATSWRDPRVHPVDDRGRLLDDPEKQREDGEGRRSRQRAGKGPWFCCVCFSLIIILILIIAAVVVAVVWALTGFQFGATASVTTVSTPTIVVATATTIPATADTIMMTDEDVTAEVVTFDMSTTDYTVGQTGETNTWATTDEPTSTVMETT